MKWSSGLRLRGFALAGGLLAVAFWPGRGDAAATTEARGGERLMRARLAAIAAQATLDHPFLGDAVVERARSRLAELTPDAPLLERWRTLEAAGAAELNAGNFDAALRLREQAYALVPALRGAGAQEAVESTLFDLAVNHLRLGETRNCAESYRPESCILPLRDGAIHRRREGSERAIRFFEELLALPPGDRRHRIEARWLLNLAYMTLDEYPDGVPEAYRIPPAVFASEVDIPRFRNVAPELGLATFGMSGGVVADDLDGDLDLDLLVSDWRPDGVLRLFVNQGDGSFSERGSQAGLDGLTGGLNMVHADYDNDGDLDVYVLRGAWLESWGDHPNSLLRNNGDATFTDVTFEAGLALRHYPTQTAAWADYDNDGDVDLYVGNEDGPGMSAPSQLFRNQGDGTFVDVAAAAGVENRRYAKGVVWGDYDGDRWPDLYVSNLDAENRLYRNRGDGTFEDVAPALGVSGPLASFPVWFWDYDNDGVLDLYVASYPRSLADVAASALGEPFEGELPRLYRGDGAGGFTEVAAEVGLTRLHDTMGSNFGDLDGDGFLDFYLGTGFPPFHAITPNAMYLNRGGRRFADVSSAGGFGHLQKGHAVAFADLDGDGDQDVFEEMGGALRGDEFHDVLYENPGFGNHSLTVNLAGTRSNRAGIGARIAVGVVEGGAQRTVYRLVTSGGSFGAGPLRQTVGLGKADAIEWLEVYWPTSDTTQRWTEVPLDAALEVTEGEASYRLLDLPRFELAGSNAGR